MEIKKVFFRILFMNYIVYNKTLKPPMHHLVNRHKKKNESPTGLSFLFFVAERGGFEPSVRIHVHMISNFKFILFDVVFIRTVRTTTAFTINRNE